MMARTKCVFYDPNYKWLRRTCPPAAAAAATLYTSVDLLTGGLKLLLYSSRARLKAKRKKRPKKNMGGEIKIEENPGEAPRTDGKAHDLVKRQTRSLGPWLGFYSPQMQNSTVCTPHKSKKVQVLWGRAQVPKQHVVCHPCSNPRSPGEILRYMYFWTRT